MTDREVMQMALDALEKLNKDGWILADFEDEVYSSIEALQTALAQSEAMLTQDEQRGSDEPQEPVAWRWLYAGKPEGDQCFSMPSPDAYIVARAAACEFPRTVQYLYTAPPQRKWQGLTDEEVKRLYKESRQPGGAVVRTAEQLFETTCRAIEAKLKEKNT